MNNLPKIIINTPKPSPEMSNLLSRKLELILQQSAGKSVPFRLSIGDRVEDFYTFTPAVFVGTVSELYRENGHNKIATEQGFFREKDLRISTQKGNQ